jgi:aromatic ring hydroxylase
VLRTGQDYIESLRDGGEVRIDGERVHRTLHSQVHVSTTEEGD